MSDWTDHSKGARPMIDVDPCGLPPEELRHRYLPDTDREKLQPGWRDPGDCCQFTAGGARCRSSRADHVNAWPWLCR